MLTKQKVMAAAAMLTIVSGTPVGTSAAGAATSDCGENCIVIFSHALGTYGEPRFVETVLDGVAQVGQPLILSEANGSDPSQDLIPDERQVSAYHAAGMVSAKVNDRYGDYPAAQIEYSPSGVGSDLCVGLASAASQNAGLVLQPCNVSATTVWIIDPLDRAPQEGVFALVNGSTKHLVRPYAMVFPTCADPTDESTSQIRVRRLQVLGPNHTPPLRQLWGAFRGPLAD
jgi:hypothetical protein